MILKPFDYKLLYKPALINDKVIIFADDIASGRPCKLIERMVENNILPYYANTHSNAYCGILMKKLIQETRDYIRMLFKLKSYHKILFTGNGCTGAINHLVNSINYLQWKTVNIFITKYEHYSNYLPWIEMAKQHTNINVIIYDHDTELLRMNSDINVRNIISITMCSNVTGKITDLSIIKKIRTISKNTYLFLDMACSAPYVSINMDDLGADAIFISPHKFLGGPSTAGLLIVDEKIFTSEHPYCPGGGCVKNATSEIIVYEDSLERKEVGGTPNIIGIIKIKYILELKSKLFDIISNNELIIASYVYARFALYMRKYKIIVIDGCSSDNRLPIVSFSISGVHYNYIVALLNDQFSIQSRGGINCCGLLGEYYTKKYGITGWCRISFNYMMSADTINFILDAVEHVIINHSIYTTMYKYDAAKNLYMLL